MSISGRGFRYDKGDLALIKEVFADPLFLKFMQPRNKCRATSKGDLEMRLLSLARQSGVRHGGLRVMCSQDDNEPVGICGVLTNSNSFRLPEISVYIRRSCRSQGFARRCIELVVCDFNGQSLGAFVDYDNDRCQRLMDSIGMIRSGIAYHSRLEREGLLFVGTVEGGKISTFSAPKD